MNLAKRLEIPKLVSKCKKIVQGEIALPSLPSVEKLFSENGTQSENVEANLAPEAIILVSPENRQLDSVVDSHDRQEIAELPQVSSTTLPSEELPLVAAENAASQQQQVDIVLQEDSMLVSVDSRYFLSNLSTENRLRDRFFKLKSRQVTREAFCRDEF
jgi:hypothetical protein